MDDTKIMEMLKELTNEIDYDIYKDIFVYHERDQTSLDAMVSIVKKYMCSSKKAVKKKSGRTFAKISEQDLKKKIQAVFEEGGAHCDFRNLVNKLGKDIKVKFDCENFSHENEDDESKILGYHTLDNDLTFCGMSAGGDWERPVYFIVYWDGKKLRGYVPTDGNCWNTSTRQAYGNDEDADFKNAKKRWPVAFAEEDSGDIVDCVDYNEDEMLKDIRERFV